MASGFRSKASAAKPSPRPGAELGTSRISMFWSGTSRLLTSGSSRWVGPSSASMSRLGLAPAESRFHGVSTRTPEATRSVSLSGELHPAQNPPFAARSVRLVGRAEADTCASFLDHRRRDLPGRPSRGALAYPPTPARRERSSAARTGRSASGPALPSISGSADLSALAVHIPRRAKRQPLVTPVASGTPFTYVKSSSSRPFVAINAAASSAEAISVRECARRGRSVCCVGVTVMDRCPAGDAPAIGALQRGDGCCVYSSMAPPVRRRCCRKV